MIAPPPMPNRPARMPVSTPPSDDRQHEPGDFAEGNARSRSSLTAWWLCRVRRQAAMCARFGAAVQYAASAALSTSAPAPAFTASVGEMPAEGARARHAAEQAQACGG